jgi:hypothetical protein
MMNGRAFSHRRAGTQHDAGQQVCGDLHPHRLLGPGATGKKSGLAGLVRAPRMECL